MKKFFIAIAAIATAAACSQNETISLDKGEAISFGNAFVENSVRAATDPSYGTNNLLKEVYVYGTVDGDGSPVSIFNHERVWSDAINAADIYNKEWKCDVKQYWIAGADYKFAAIAGADKTNVTCTEGIPTLIKFTSNGATDLVYGYFEKANAAASNNGLVAFSMKHLLSKVKFTVNNTNPAASEYLYTVTGIKISNAITEANCAITNGWVNNAANVSTTWTTTATAGQEFGNITANANATTECDAEKLLIPLTNAKVEFTVNLYYDNIVDDNLVSSTAYTGDKAITVASLEAGKAYNLTISVGVGELIQFTVTESPEWTNSNPYPTPIQ